MIRTRFATVTPEEWGCTVRFDDGTSVPAQAFHDDPHYRVIAHRTGYQDDTRAYCIAHEIAHLVAEEVLHGRPSRVLWGLAHGAPLTPQDAAYEECMTQTLQRFVQTKERPIIGGVEWNRLADRMREVMGC